MLKNIKKILIIFSIFVGIFTAIMAIGINYYLHLDHKEKIESNKESNIDSLEEVDASLTERFNILVMGVDYLKLGEKSGQRGTRTDTIMIFSIDPKTNKMFILSIPRDSRVNIDGIGYDKVNHAHSYGGSELAIKTIKNLLDIPIHHYIKIDYNAVIELVDSVGGVEIDIKQDMNYAPLGINFKKGINILNGEDAVKYLRFRSGYANADIGRIGAQQEFIKLLIEKILSPSIVTNIPKYIEILEKNIETDLSKRQMLIFAKEFSEININNLRKEILPGEGQMIDGISYYVIYEQQMKDLINDLLSDDYINNTENIKSE